MNAAIPHCFKWFRQAILFALARALFNAGRSIEAKIAMIAMTLHSKSGFFMANYGKGAFWDQICYCPTLWMRMWEHGNFILLWRIYFKSYQHEKYYRYERWFYASIKRVPGAVKSSQENENFIFWLLFCNDALDKRGITEKKGTETALFQERENALRQPRKLVQEFWPMPSSQELLGNFSSMR